jgi:hypothetical protein
MAGTARVVKNLVYLELMWVNIDDVETVGV